MSTSARCAYLASSLAPRRGVMLGKSLPQTHVTPARPSRCDQALRDSGRSYLDGNALRVVQRMEQALQVETIANEASTSDIAALRAFMDRHPRLFVLTGAGMSTESGIPGYRDANGQWMRSAPVLWQE